MKRELHQAAGSNAVFQSSEGERGKRCSLNAPRLSSLHNVNFFHAANTDCNTCGDDAFRAIWASARLSELMKAGSGKKLKVLTGNAITSVSRRLKLSSSLAKSKNNEILCKVSRSAFLFMWFETNTACKYPFLLDFHSTNSKDDGRQTPDSSAD